MSCTDKTPPSHSSCNCAPEPFQAQCNSQQHDTCVWTDCKAHLCVAVIVSHELAVLGGAVDDAHALDAPNVVATGVCERVYERGQLPAARLHMLHH